MDLQRQTEERISETFDLSASFEELESSAIFDGARDDDSDVKQDPFSTLRPFLREEIPDQAFNFSSRAFIQSAYYAVKRAASEGRWPGRMEAGLMNALTRRGKTALGDGCNTKEPEKRWVCQEELRVCIFFICHLVKVTDASLASGKEDKDISGRQDWLDTKVSAVTFLGRVCASLTKAFSKGRDVEEVAELVERSALDIFISQNWQARSAQAKLTLQTLRETLVRILAQPFLDAVKRPKHASDLFDALASLWVEKQQLIDAMAEVLHVVMDSETKCGASLLSRVVDVVISRTNAANTDKMALLQDHIEAGMAVLTKYADRESGAQILAAFLSPLSSVVLNERSGIRKSFLDIVCSCLACIRLSRADRKALLKIAALLLTDKDANVRLRVLSTLSKSPQCLDLLEASASFPIVETMIKRLLDKSKTVRLKALQTLERVLSYLSDSSRKSFAAEEDDISGMGFLRTKTQIQTALFPVLTRMLTIPQDSPYFCKESLLGAAQLLSMPCKLGVMQPYLESLIAMTHSPDSRALTTKVLQAHLDSYQAWSSLLCSSSDRALAKLDGFLKDASASPSSGNDGEEIVHSGAPQQKHPSERHQKLVLHALDIILQLQSREVTEAELLGALKIIVFLMAPHSPVRTRLGDLLHSLVFSVRWSAQLHGSVEKNEGTLDGNDCLKWSLKACATVSRKMNIKVWTEAEDLMRLHFVSLYPLHKEELIELLYSMGDPLRLSEEILRAHVEAGVFTIPQHLGTLVHFVQWIGDMSRNYKTAETLFLSQMRDSGHAKERRTSRLEDGFDYMDEEDEKANEEDAVQHFAASLLAGDSVPGCYVPLLAHIASDRNLPTILRAAVLKSLGHFLLLSPDLAKQHKQLVQDLLKEGAPEMKLAALEVASKLVLQAPNEYAPVFETIQQLLLDSDVKEAAYCVFAGLLLQQKLRAHVYLGAITAGLVDSSAKIRRLMVYVLQRLLEDSGRARYKIVVDAFKQSAPEVRTGLLETLLDGFLDEKDLKADDLASHVLQLLVLGTEGAADFAAHLTPSAKVLQHLGAHVQACPPRISASNDPESVEALCKFVANHRKHSSATTASKDLVNRLLDHFQKKTRRRKRRAEISTAPESSSLGAIEEYARAVDAFKEKADASSIYDIIGDR